MPAPVVIKFQVDGIENVSRAFRSVEDAIARAETSSNRSVRTRTSNEDRAARDAIKAAEKAERERTRLTERGMKDRERDDAKARAQQERDYAYLFKAQEKAEKDKTQATEREARERQKIVEREYADSQRAQRSLLRDYERTQNEQTRIAEQASRKRSEFARTMAGAAGQGLRAGVGRVAGITGVTAATALQLGGGFSIADSVQAAQAAQRQAAILSNNAYLPGTKVDPAYAGKDAERADPSKLLAKARATSIETGVDTSQLLEAATMYVKRSSDLGGAMGNMGFFAKLATSTGGSVVDVADAAGKLQKQSGMDQKGVRETMLGMVQAGKLGSITLDEMASAAPKITKTRSYYQGDEQKTQQTLLGLAQIASRSGGGAAEAGTTVSNLAQDALKHKDRINAMGGKSITDAHGKLLAPEDLIAEVFRKSQGDMSKIQGMGFGARSIKMFGELQSTFEKGGGFKDTEAGIRAVRAEMAPVTNAKYDEAKLEEDIKAVQSTRGFENALNELKEKLGAELLPEFEKLIPTIKELTPQFVEMAKTALPAFVELIKTVADLITSHKGYIDTLAAHPVGTIIAFEVSKSIAGAMIGQGIKSTIESAIKSSGGGGTNSNPLANNGGGGDGGRGLATASIVAMAAYAVTDVTEGANKGTIAGQQRVDDLKKNGDVAGAQRAIAEANRKGGALGAAGAAGGVIHAINMAAAPITFGAQPAIDAGIKKLTGKENASSNAVAEFFDAQAVKKAMTTTMIDAIHEAGRKGASNGGVDTPARSTPIGQRNGGTQ